ncbi:MAG: chemotaxis protein CheW [Rubrivivax sp.]
MAAPRRRTPGARREALRALQLRLLERLRGAGVQPQRRAWLAVEAGEVGYLLPLAESGEIFTEARVMPLPHTQPWFQGVANLRGDLHGVVDLEAFLGGHRRGARLAGGPPHGSRLVCLNPGLGAQCALRVDALVGLRHADELRPDEQPPGVQPSFARRRWRDEGGRVWLEIDLAGLAANDAFLGISTGGARR